MDPITQGALGAVAAASLASAPRVRVAALLGWVGGMLPDADVFIRSASDPLLSIEYHRHFTHSLVFIPVGGLICAAALWWFVRKRLPFPLVYLYATAGYATGGLLDACTSYGTQLLWPFSDLRVSWNIIAIVDPLFTLPLIVLVGLACHRRRPMWTRWAAGFALAYLAFGVIQRERASGVQHRLAVERGHHDITRATVKPTIGNLIVWRSLYRHEGIYHVDAIRIGFFRFSKIYAGDTVAEFDHAAAVAALPADSVLAHDIRRFAHFSEDYVVALPGRESFLTDLRYSPAPHSLEPLWGIDLSGRGPQDHVRWVEREFEDGKSGRSYGMILWAMLRGDPLPTGEP